VVVGGGDTAVKDALFLTRFGHTITLVHRRDRLRAEKILQEQFMSSSKVRCEWDSVVTAIEGDQKVTSIKIKNVKNGQERTFPCEGVFILVGITPMTDFLKETVGLDDAGFIKTTDTMETNQPGIFAAGDCRQKLLRQIVTACGDGATAAFASQHYVSRGTSPIKS
jgi:thioredoxin reductase (NADPH)